MKRTILLLIPGLILLSGCVRARHQRPETPLPAGYRGQAETAGGQSASFGELRWEDLIRDERLNELIAEALANNVDAKTALARVAEARANLGAVRSQRYPGTNGSAGYSNIRTARDGASPIPDGYSAESDYTAFSGGFSWEVRPVGGASAIPAWLRTRICWLPSKPVTWFGKPWSERWPPSIFCCATWIGNWRSPGIP